MNKYSQSEPLRIVDAIENEGSQEQQLLDHFEIIYIHYGEGTHFCNEKSIPYEKGDLFLVAPGDNHFFNIESVTHFTYIRLTPAYFECHSHNAKDDFYEVSPMSIMQIQWMKQDKITVRGRCQEILRNIFYNVVLYNCYVDIVRSPIVYFHILSIFAMIKECLEIRNIEFGVKVPTNPLIAAYIQENIYNRESISIKSISEYFNISATYFSSYFKRNFGVSYREYLEKIQVQLIKKRLQTKKLTLKEIADELGFSDVSHLSKFFKKREGVNPTQFKDNDQKIINSPIR